MKKSREQSPGKAKAWEFLRLLLVATINATWVLLVIAKHVLQWLQNTFRIPDSDSVSAGGGIAAGKTVLVTTGRQAKTLHTVRALKQIGARVIVADYETVSASALSVACDKFVLLPALDTSRLDDWVESFRDILVQNNVDVVLPVSTINEVLFIGLAKDKLSKVLPNVTWFCPDLETAVNLDDRTQFSIFCDMYDVPTPEHGILSSREDITNIVKNTDHVILKRVASSVNRAEEIVPLRAGQVVPSFIQPSKKDPWQWQRFIKGDEYSAWYISNGGVVTFAACYRSAFDLVEFDGVPLADDFDVPIRKLISGMKLTGQFAFDFIREKDSNKPYIIECNPRASSILETVSETPLWAEAFFGIDVIHRTISRPVGFVFHKNCWPWASRSEGYFKLSDPFPFFGAEIMWPLNAIGNRGLINNSIQKIDVNICKAIVDGPSPGRDLQLFKDEVEDLKISEVVQAVKHADTVLLDISTPKYEKVQDASISAGRRVVHFSYDDGENIDLASLPSECVSISSVTELDNFIQTNCSGETRLVLGEKLSKISKSSSTVSYRLVTISKSLAGSFEIPLRKLRVLHVMGSTASKYYEGISSYYGFECINSVGTDGRFDHVIAYVHLSGEWTIGVNCTISEVRDNSPKLSTGEAVRRLEALMVDVAIPHMFDYDGLTAYRGLLRVVNVPIVGCSAEALALSTNKARTKACAAMEGVGVAKSVILHRGDTVDMELPVIFKPVEEDNSLGITVIRDAEKISEGLEHAFKFGDEVLCEQFIELGRELRVAIIETGSGEMEMLPIIEYMLSKESPIRRPEDKISTNKAGRPTGLASGGRVCPADVDDELKEKLFKSSVTAHRALGCTDYSIYDYRIDSKGNTYLLESCLYCSFAPKSVLVSMQATMGIEHPELFVRFCERALSRKADRSSTEEKIGMK